MRYPLFILFFILTIFACLLIGCGNGGGSSQGFFGTNADCGIGGTSDDPPDGTQFAEYSFTISGTASGVTDPITGEPGPRPDNFLVYEEDVMPPGLRLDPAGNADTTSDIEVIGSPWASGFQTIRVLAADEDNPSCFTTFEFTVLIGACDLGISPFDGDNPLPEDLATSVVDEFLSTSIDRSANIGTSDQITVSFLTEFFDGAGDPIDPFTDSPVPGMTFSIAATSEILAPIDITGVPSTIGVFVFTVRISASAVDPDPTLDPGACVVEETYAITITAPPP